MERGAKALTLGEVYAKASAHARAWKADAIPARIPDLEPDFFRNGAKLYALAKEKRR